MSRPKLVDRVRSAARLRHLGLRTERSYSDRIRRLILFRGRRRPSEMGAEEVRQFHPRPAVAGQISDEGLVRIPFPA